MQEITVFRSAVAAGVTSVSSDDIATSGMRGKGVAVLHVYQDHLWSVHTVALLISSGTVRSFRLLLVWM